MDLNIFKVDASIAKNINVQPKNIKFSNAFQRKPRNFVYDGNIYFFRMLRILGLFPITRNSNGKHFYITIYPNKVGR